MAFDKELLERFYDKQEQMAKDISEIKILLGKQEENLKLHIYRTELAEQNIEFLREQIKPLEIHAKSISNMIKMVGFISILVGIMVGIFELARFISS